MVRNTLHTPTSSTQHPYLYGQALDIFHANVSFIGILPDGSRCYTYHRIDFIWVRWYTLELGVEFGLDVLRPCPLIDSKCLGFIGPAAILRAIHLIPRFSDEKLDEREEWAKLVPWWVPYPGLRETLWSSYYINR